MKQVTTFLGIGEDSKLGIAINSAIQQAEDHLRTYEDDLEIDQDCVSHLTTDTKVLVVDGIFMAWHTISLFYDSK